MFSDDQERDEYEDELYGEEDSDSDLSAPDSELEFHLYSQLHYRAGPELQEDQENQEDQDQRGATPQAKAQDELPQPGQGASSARPALPPPWPVEVIVIDSGPDVTILSDSTEEDEGVCTLKGSRSKAGREKRSISHSHTQNKAAKTANDAIVIVDSESEPDGDSGSDSGPEERSESEVRAVLALDVEPDSDSESDSDGLESWMLLGPKPEDRDLNLQLNLTHSSTHSYTHDDKDDEETWAISDKDREAQIFNKGRGPRRLSNRYYTEKTVTCRSCNRLGHLSKNCPTPKKLPCCVLCGGMGHLQKTCPRRHCSNCALPGHVAERCLDRAYWHKRCHRCGMTGHFYDACPEIWRQYHLTTSSVDGVCKGVEGEARRSVIYCYNCSRKGHCGYECTQRRMFNFTFPSLPFICHYDTQREIQSRRKRMQRRARDLHEAGLLELDESATQLWPEEGATPLPAHPPRKKQKTSDSHTHTPNTHNPHMLHGPKKRFANTPKHKPQPKTHTPHGPKKHIPHTPKHTPQPNTHTLHGPKKRIAHTPKHTPQPNTDTQHGPKKRIAHTPKHTPQPPHVNTHTPKHTPQPPHPNTHTPCLLATHTPHSAHLPPSQRAKGRKRPRRSSAALQPDESQDFPRGPKQAHPWPRRTPGTPLRPKAVPEALFSSPKMQQKKKRARARGRDRKAARASRDTNPTDENLFLIKQRKPKRAR